MINLKDRNQNVFLSTSFKNLCVEFSRFVKQFIYHDGVDKKPLAVVCRWSFDRANSAIIINIWQ